MKTTQTRRTLSILTGLALLGAMMLSGGALDAAAAVLFYDPFTTANTNDINATIAARQSGVVAPVSYLAGGNGLSAYSINGNALEADIPPASSLTSVSPNHNFTESGAMSISVDIKPVTSPDGWDAFIIGDSINQSHFFLTGTDIFFNHNGTGGTVFDAGVYVASFSLPAPDANGYWNLRFDINTGTDSVTNGLADVKAYVGGALIASFTRSTPYSSNYLSLETVFLGSPQTDVTLWDNLQVVTIVPEPTTVGLLGLGGLILGWHKRRLK